ncbi:organic cation/carnitine transporter 2-like [Euphorbia lathyris]|uniref:organic cation/carnitine transporter 2-like n=1 Tax=Euphorbia lathyris TaxID=212925 RepID=UPI003313E14E
MADSTTPLLSQSKKNSDSPSLDETIEHYLSDFNLTQLSIAIFVSISWFFDAQQTFISVFSEAEPKWHYKKTSPFSATIADLCKLPADSWEWDKPNYTSVISEFQLQCSNSLLRSLPASSFFFGCLAGGFLLATLADSCFGRKNMLFLSCLMMGVSSLLTVFSPDIWVYSGLKFVNGFGRATIGGCALVLATEIVGKKWRGQVGVLGFVCFTLGFLSLPLIAYMNRDSSWRVLYLWTSVPTILYSILVRFFVVESPRWLFCRGRREEALAVLRSISSVKSDDFEFDQQLQYNNNHDMFSSIKILLEKNWVFRRLSAVMVIGFGTGVVYYGMPLGLGNSSFNLYLSTTFNALSKLPASLVTFVLISKLNRKTSLLIFSTVSGICSVMVAVLGNLSANLEIGLEMVSFFCACSLFDILLIFTTELFPTSVRNSAMSMVRQAVVLGGVFGPMLVDAGRKNRFFSYGIFGLMIGICGMFVICVKETKGETICDTIEEEECKQAKMLCC